MQIIRVYILTIRRMYCIIYIYGDKIVKYERLRANMKTSLRILGKAAFFLILLIGMIILANYPLLILKPFGFNLEQAGLQEISSTVISYFYKLIHGSMGTYKQGLDVWVLIKTHTGSTLIMLSISLLIAILFGVVFGYFLSKKQKPRTSTLKLILIIILMSVPTLIVILGAQQFFLLLKNAGLSRIPVAGYATWRHRILPVFCAALLPGVYLARLFAGASDRVYETEYIRTAISKGAGGARVFFVHVLKNAFAQVCESIHSILPLLLVNMLIAEYLFYCPGLLLVMVNNYYNPDVVVGVSIVVALIYTLYSLVFTWIGRRLNHRMGISRKGIM